MRNSLSSTGEECFREMLGKNPKNMLSLIAWGAICQMNGKKEEARICLESALKIQPDNTLANIILVIQRN
jgi:hypothetical protein